MREFTLKTALLALLLAVVLWAVVKRNEKIACVAKHGIENCK